MNTNTHTLGSIFKTVLGVALFCGVFAGLSFMTDSFQNSENSALSPSQFSASIFNVSSNASMQNHESDLMIPHYAAEKNETGEIEIRANKNLGNIAGFSFALLFPENYLTANNINVSGTILQDKGFFVQKNVSESGKISVVGATGGSGVEIAAGDLLLKIEFTIEENTPLGSKIEISAERFSLISADLEEKIVTLSAGTLEFLKNSSAFLEIQKISAKETGILEIEFSEEISEAALSQFSFLPSNAKNSETELIISGKKIEISGLDLVPNTEYQVFISDRIKSNGGKILPTNTVINGQNWALGFSFYPEHVLQTIAINTLKITGPQLATAYFTQKIPADITLTKEDISITSPSTEIEKITLDISREFVTIETKNENNDRDLTQIFPKPTVALSSDFQKKLQDETIQYSLEIDSVESISPSHFSITFSEEISDDDLLALSGELNPLYGEKIQIQRLEKDAHTQTKIHVYTRPQEAGKFHRYSIIPEKFHALNNKKLGGKNSIIFTTIQAENPEISRVEPVQFTQGEISELHILGKNFSTIASEISVKTGEEELEIVSVSSNGESLVVKIPADIETGSKTIILSQGATILNKNDIFIVHAPEKTITIDSEKSYSSPLKVPNDNTTTYSLFALIDNPDGLANIEKVTVDMRPFEGIAEVVMTAGEVVNNKQYFVIEDLVIPTTVATKNSAYELQVTAKSRFGSVSVGNISVFVTKDINASVAPEIKNFSVSQSTVSPGDTENPLIFSAEIFDVDGNDDISKVIVDLTKLGLGVEFLEAKNSGDSESKTWFFEKKDIVIPPTVSDGEYQIVLAAIDKTGEESRKTITIKVSRNANFRPEISLEESYISPSSEILKGQKFKIHIKVSDPSGSEDIESVSANLSALGLSPISLTKGATEGRSQWFSSEELEIPENINFGDKKITITASDTSGNFDSQKLSVQISGKTSTGFAPEVVTNRGYATPATAIPDGKTPFSAYIFVEDKDQDVSHVILQLGNYAKFVGETLPSETLDEGKTCLSTRTLLCLKPILKEADGQWFFVNNLIVPRGIESGSEPYNLNVIAVDKTGKIGKGFFKMLVGDSVSMQIHEKPYFRFASPLSPEKIQMVISSALAPENIKQEYFTISSAENSQDTLNISEISVSPDGKLVTLFTENQIPGKPYFVQINTEKLGLRSQKQSDRIVEFSGYEIPSRTKSIKIIENKSTSPKTFILRFNQKMNVLSAREKQNIKIFELGKKDQLDIISLEFLSPEVLQVRTSEQTPGKTYEIYVNKFESTTGEKIQNSIRKVTQGFTLSLAESLASLHHRADFNADKKVDFKDFTMFASVYGKTYQDASEAGDFNNDAIVDFSDFTLFSSRYGQDAPTGTEGTTLLNPANNNSEGESF